MSKGPSARTSPAGVCAVSACLAGVPCRYDGRSRPDEMIVAMVADGSAHPMCPEVLGGLATPRPPAETVGGDGSAVLAGAARIMCDDGTDATADFVAGALRAADEMAVRGIAHAILQARSPTCGCGEIYDGTFTGTVTDGDGVFAAVLRSRGITIESRRGERV